MSNNDYESIEQAVELQESSGWGWLTGIGGALVYLAVVIYAEVRGWTLITATMEPGLISLAAVGILALGFTALLMPIFIHRVASHGPQRTWAVVFYAFDLLAMGCNAVLDAARHSGTLSNDFLLLWGTWAVPALPLFVGVGWSLIWLTDPKQRERDAERRLTSAESGSMHRQMVRAADSENVREAIEAAASRSAGVLVGRALGVQPSTNGKRNSRPDVVVLESEGADAAPRSKSRGRK